MDVIRNIDLGEFYSLSDLTSKIEFLLKFAVLAPSTHNSQPWLFKLGDGYCEIHRDDSKALPYADKTGKCLIISLGCCIENLVLVSKYYNVFKSIELNENGTMIARITFDFSKNYRAKNGKEQNLIKSMLLRQNSRGKYYPKDISSNDINKLGQIALEYPEAQYTPVTSKRDIQTLSKLSSDATIIASNNKKFREEMSKWIIPSISNKKEGMPGYALKVPLLISLFLSTVIRNLDIGKVTSMGIKANFDSAALINIFTTKSNSLTELITVGRLAERIMLELRMRKIGTSISMAAIEIDEVREQVQDILPSQNIPQFIFTAGYISQNHRFTPRYSAFEKIIK